MRNLITFLGLVLRLVLCKIDIEDYVVTIWKRVLKALLENVFKGLFYVYILWHCTYLF